MGKLYKFKDDVEIILDNLELSREWIETALVNMSSRAFRDGYLSAVNDYLDKKLTSDNLSDRMDNLLHTPTQPKELGK